MASKTYTLFVDGEDAVDYGSKKTAVKYGDESGKTYQVHSPSGAVVHAVQVDEPEAPVEDLIGDVPTDGPAESSEPVEEPETLFYESLDFPGNYSIVMAPFAQEIAEAASVPTKVETFGSKLTRRVWFGGPDMDRAQAVMAVVKEEAANALEVLHDWQKEHIEERRGLTDMQRYLQHREVLAEHGHKVARHVKKNGLS